MKKISKQSAKRMIKALEYALDCVKRDATTGLCSGIEYAAIYNICDRSEFEYVCHWIKKMLGNYSSYLENLHGTSVYSLSAQQRYEHRKPWVEWMIQHLRETT